ncbi:MAG: DUF2933 domain-containing protein [Haloechinothrix sp.]
MCFNRKVIAALAAVGLGLWLLSPNLLAGVVPLLLLAACPLSMIFMMRAMPGAAPTARRRTPPTTPRSSASGPSSTVSGPNGRRKTPLGVVGSGDDAHLAVPADEVGVAQPEGLADAHSRLGQQREQEPVAMRSTSRPCRPRAAPRAGPRVSAPLLVGHSGREAKAVLHAFETSTGGTGWGDDPGPGRPRRSWARTALRRWRCSRHC